MIYKIVKELPRRSAIVEGSWSELSVGNEIIAEDDNGVLYDAVVDTRITSVDNNRVVVSIKGVLVD